MFALRNEKLNNNSKSVNPVCRYQALVVIEFLL